MPSYALKLLNWLPKQTQTIWSYSKNFKIKTVIPFLTRTLLLQLEVLFSILQVASRPSLLRRWYGERVKMMPSSYQIGLSQKKRCLLLRIVKQISKWLMFRNMLPPFVDLCQGAFSGFLLISSHNVKSFVFSSWNPLERVYSLANEESKAQSLKR